MADVKARVWRTGSRVGLNMYEGDRAVCQCHTEEDARAIVDAMNERFTTAGVVVGLMRVLRERNEVMVQLLERLA